MLAFPAPTLKSFNSSLAVLKQEMIFIRSGYGHSSQHNELGRMVLKTLSLRATGRERGNLPMEYYASIKKGDRRAGLIVEAL